MNRTTYISLLFLTLGLSAYTGYYAFTRPDTIPVAVTASPLPLEEVPAKNILTTKTGKVISIKETNPAGENLSTITLSPKGFVDNAVITLEKNKLTNFFLIDLDKDGFDELALITTAEGPGSYGELTLFSTKDDAGLIKIDMPEVTEETTKKGALLEGYSGHDTFIKENGLLTREFPIYVGTDTNALPSGGIKKLTYSLSFVNGKYIIVLEKEAATSTLATSTIVATPTMKKTVTTIMATTTMKTTATTTKVSATSSQR